MRINVYSQELTDEVVVVEKTSNTGRVYKGVQLILHSSERLHHPPMDDDRSAVTFWLPSSMARCGLMARAFEKIADAFVGHQDLEDEDDAVERAKAAMETLAEEIRRAEESADPRALDVLIEAMDNTFSAVNPKIRVLWED